MRIRFRYSLAAGIREARSASVLEAPRAALTGAAMPLGPSGIATIVAATWGTDGVRITPWTRGFAVSPGAPTVLHYTVTALPDARPGAQWWAMVRLGWFGRVLYTPTVPITIAG
jgi:hypothetical protein